METSPLPGKATDFDLCLALMVIEQLGLFSVPHLLWHGPSVYYAHIQGPITLSPFAERLPEELSLPVFRLWSVATGDRNPDLPHT